MTRYMNNKLMRLLTVMMLMMFSLGAWAQGKYVTVNLGADSDGKFTDGTIVEAGQVKDGDEVTVTLTVTPASGYTFNKKNATVYATISTNGTRSTEISRTLTLDGPEGDVAKSTDYTVTVDANLGVWVQSATFSPVKRDGSKGLGDTYRYNYYVINQKGEVAMFCSESQTSGQAPRIPAIIKTPLLADEAFHYYAMDDLTWDNTSGTLYWKWTNNYAWSETSNGSTTQFGIKAPYGKFTVPDGAIELAILPATNYTNIIVTYDADATIQEVNDMTIDLSGNVSYNIAVSNSNQTNPVYFYTTGTGLSVNTSNPDAATLGGNNYRWTFQGNDPYDIRLHSVTVDASTPDKQLASLEVTNSNRDVQVGSFSFQETVDKSSSTSYAYHSFVLLQGQDGKFELAYAHQRGMNRDSYNIALTYLTTNNAGTAPMIRADWGASVSPYSPSTTWTHLSDNVQVTLTPFTPTCTTPTITYDYTTNNVTIASTTEGATIYYTSSTSGAAPDAPTTSAYTGTGTTPIVISDISAATIFKAIAVKSGYNNSEVATETVELADPGLSGIYYIQNQNNTNHYLYPSTEIGSDGNLCVKTAQDRKLTAVWKLRKSGDYYYIIHYEDGKYMKADNSYPLEKAVTLVTTTPPDDDCLFELVENGTGIYNIKPKGVSRTDGNYFLNPKGGVGKNIGLYIASDKGSKWKLVNAPLAPTITVNDINVTFTNNFGSGGVYYTYQIGSRPADPTKTETVPSTSLNLEYGPKYFIKAVTIYDEKGDNLISIISEKNFQENLISPLFTVASNTVTITNSQASGVTFRYTQSDDGTDPADPVAPSGAGTDGASVALTAGQRNVIKAIAYNTVEGTTYKSSIATVVVDLRGATPISKLSDIDDASGNYKLETDFTVDSRSGNIGTTDNPFKGTIDGQMNAFSLVGNDPLFECVEDATIKNVIISNASVTTSGHAGAIANVAKGASRIYNCGVLHGSVSGSNYVGGLVGLLDGEARVINCYSYANISGGTDAGGIVGYNNFASTNANIRTMVMNCMFYGNISGATNISPVYGGLKISNAGSTGLNNFNYFRYESDYSKNGHITSGKYNCALGAEDSYLVRFEFHRNILNSNRELASWYATANVDKTHVVMAKWVLDKSIADYPILKVQGTYPSVINYDATKTTTDDNKGGILTSKGTNGTLTVNIQMGSGGVQFAPPSGASIKNGFESMTLNITDKDPDNYNFNYGKIQLPYYNEVGEGNYTGNRVVTGWKIVKVTNGTKGTYSESSSYTENTFGDYNFADREHWAKDYYDTSSGGSGRIFNQGAYWEVPDGVTAITIEPYWAKCVYVSDPYYDETYNTAASMSNVTAMGERYTNGSSYDINGSSQVVYTTLANARTALASNSSHTPYDYAIVLVGNYHHYQGNNNYSITGSQYSNNVALPYTFMSADLDFDNEPDNVMFYQHGPNRTGVSPVRFDFLFFPGIGMAQRVDGVQFMPEAGIFWNYGWFEITNTSLIKVSAIEYCNNKKVSAPLILQGGIFRDLYSYQAYSGTFLTPYIHLGGNVYFEVCSNGDHLNSSVFTPHIPISVTGGEFEKFYLSGNTMPKGTTEPASDTDDAECYIDGGKFDEVAGAGMWPVDGNVSWSIHNADIESFYGGGINDRYPVTGNISTTIKNSRVGTFCGGPKFGNMTEGTTVNTNATGCTFGTFFGAGYGGTAFNRITATENNNVTATTFSQWASWISTYYLQQYNALNRGISTNYELIFMPFSGGASMRNVAQIYVNYASMSLATTKDVTTTLNGCTVTGNFYGGGSRGKVDGNIESTLIDCTMKGNVFGAGYSASIPSVEVYPSSGYDEPYMDGNAGVFVKAKYPAPTTYTWKTVGSVSAGSEFDTTSEGGPYILTTTDVNGLGTVSGDATMTLKGSTTVAGNVYGGGDKGKVEGSTTVNIEE